MSRSIYLTTTIPYVNAPPHIGFALELVQADALARYHRLIGADVRFQSGTDENAFKNVLSARARGIPVERLVNENAERFRSLSALLDISVDRFVRTTSIEHRTAVGELLSRLRPDDVYRTSYEGLYCSGCEDFYHANDLESGCCPEHGTEATPVSEQNVFFRLRAYESQLRELILSRRLRIVPETREIEVLRFIDRGLVDISISRDARRCEHWGIPYPGDSTQVVYVWIDALINYLTGLGFPNDADVARYWHDATKLHVIGKNVWKFHAIYWPSLLLSAALPVPDTIVVHGFLTNDGRKISKSRGGSVDPAELVEQFGVDSVRYFLLRHIRPFDDSDFTIARLGSAYEADLANGLGNVVSRLCALAAATGVRGVSLASSPRAPARFHEHLAAFRFDLALGVLWEEIAELNRRIVDAAPWVLIKAGRAAAAHSAISALIGRLATIAHWLRPFLPSTSEEILRRVSGHSIEKGAPIFPRRTHSTCG